MIDPIVLNTNLSNASMELQNSVNSAFGLDSITVVVLLVVAAIFVGSSVARIQWVHTKLQAFSRSLYYTFVGLATTITIGVLAAPIYYLGQTDGQTKRYVLYAIGGLITVYVAFTALGYMVDKVILSTWREYQETIDQEESND